MRVETLARRLGRWAVGQFHRWEPVLLMASVVLAAAWLLAGWGLRGRRLALWCAVPVLAGVALVFILGPGRLFPKEPYEGPILVEVSERHALTALDQPGLACGGAAGLLGAWLVWVRLTGR